MSDLEKVRTVSELIDELEAIEREHGNIVVEDRETGINPNVSVIEYKGDTIVQL